MQEQFSLREIIEMLWNGKKIIIAVTILFTILSGVLSIFILQPKYEAISTVRFSEAPELLKNYTEVLKSDVVLDRVINKLDLNALEYDISSLRESLKIEAVEGTSIVRIMVEGNNPMVITNLSNLLAFEMGARAEISDRSVRIVENKNLIQDLSDQIAVIQGEINEAKKQLDETPEKLLTVRTLADDAYMLSVFNDTEDVGSKQAGALELKNESTNPLFIELKTRIANALINLTKVQQEKQIKESYLELDQTVISQLEQEISSDKLKIRTSERLLDGMQAVFISPAIEPSKPIGPNKLMNVAIGLIMGALVSVLIVIFRQYWEKTGSTNSHLNSIQHQI